MSSLPRRKKECKQKPKTKGRIVKHLHLVQILVSVIHLFQQAFYKFDPKISLVHHFRHPELANTVP